MATLKEIQKLDSFATTFANEGVRGADAARLTELHTDKFLVSNTLSA